MEIVEYIENTNLVKKWGNSFFPDYNGFFSDEYFEDDYFTKKFGRKLLVREIQGLYMGIKYPYKSNNDYNHKILYRLPKGDLFGIDTICPISIFNLKEYIGNVEDLVPEEELEKYMFNYPNHRIWNSDTLNTCKKLNWFSDLDITYLKDKGLLIEVPEWFKV